MKYYELTYLISPDALGEETKEFQEKIIAFVQNEGGVLNEKTETPKKIMLAYPIKKWGSAYLVSLNFTLDPKKLEIVEKKLKEENSILRYLILSRRVRKRIPTVRRVRRIVPPKPITKEKPLKVELKEIEKKLEEILEQ